MLTILGEAFQQNLSITLLKSYAEELCELSPDQLQVAFRRARRECKFFPRIAELLEFAGAATGDAALEVEAEIAFQSVIRTLEHNGIQAGMRHLSERTQYAIRNCGGLDTFNQRLAPDSYPFLHREFAAGYQRFTAHQELAPQMIAAGIAEPPVALLPAAPTTAKKKPAPAKQVAEGHARAVIKPVPQAMTESDLQDRKRMLRQQTDRIIALRKAASK